MDAPNAKPQHNTIKEHIIRALREDARLWHAAEGAEAELNHTLLFALLDKVDERVIGALLQEPPLKARFFVQIGGALVFKRDEFRFFLEEHRIGTSYTAYRNRIGLSDGRRFVRDTNDVVLGFPYKDCVLEGGQSSEEGHDTYYEYDEDGVRAGAYTRKTTKRSEVFFNQVLAYEEIDRLHEPKAFVRWRRYTQHGTEAVQQLARDTHGTITENMIIKGNNYLALHSLKEQFADKVKLIYIDPPYNTGNDGFKYNDNFNHSTWLVFMKNRLEVARQLLRDDGVIFVQCDDNEQAYLKVLMDEVFGRGNFVNNFSWVNNLKGRQISHYGAAKTHEFVLCYAKDVNNIGVFEMPIKTLKRLMPDVYKGFDYEIKTDTLGPYVVKNQLYNTNSAFNEETRPSLVFAIHYNPDTEEIRFSDAGDDTKIEGFLKIEPRRNRNGVHKYHAWRWSKEKILKDKANLYLKDGVLYTKVRNFETTIVKDVISNIKANGNSELKKLFNNVPFIFAKPEILLEIIIAMSTGAGDIVLDYHLGSGTTAAVAHKMGRQYIGIEQMDYIEDIAVERLKKVIGGEQGGVSKSVGWQGGGAFVYCELAKWNEAAKERITACNSTEELVAFFDEMCERYFLDYHVKTKEFRERGAQAQEFAALSLEQQKAICIDMLDNNQLYVHYTEMADAKYAIRSDEQSLTREFYGSA